MLVVELWKKWKEKVNYSHLSFYIAQNSRGTLIHHSPVSSFQLPPALPVFLGCHPASRQRPPDHRVSSQFLWACSPLACCGRTSWGSCHLPCRAAFRINLTAAGAKWPVQCCSDVCLHLRVFSYMCAIYGAASEKILICRQMGIDAQQSHTKMCCRTRSEERRPQRCQINSTSNCHV